MRKGLEVLVGEDGPVDAAFYLFHLDVTVTKRKQQTLAGKGYCG
jgi:hypothetical protein